ncbi:hypothetical protein ACIHDR_48270 [Nocardia sp. NPDC052278]|uniref:hypothetical protein n=1 Tax=unclassified Nocardia TaxID=2637762 RepID=UPI0036B2B0DC
MADLTGLTPQQSAALVRRLHGAHKRTHVTTIPEEVGAAPPLGAAPVTTKLLSVPGGLGEALPHGGLPLGRTIACTGSSTPLLGLLAAATSQRKRVAVVGRPQLGLLAFVEMGGDLTRLAHIPYPGPDPLEVAVVLLDGLDIVVLDTPDTAPASRIRAALARVRSHDAILILTQPARLAVDLEIRCDRAEYVGLARGRGLLRAVSYDITVTGRATPRPLTTRVHLQGTDDRRCAWTRQATDSAATPSPIARTG